MKYLILLLLFICNNSYSQTEQKSSDYAPFEEGKSSRNRLDRKWQLALGLGIEFGIPSMNYNASYYLDPNSLLNLRYSHRGDYDKDGGSKELSAFKFGVKKFVGNSFFYLPNIAYRNTSHTTTADYNYQDITLGVRIGNEWLLDNFTLGIDWLGFNQHIIELEEKVTPDGPVPSNADIEKTITFDFLGIYVGYSF